MRKKSKVGSIKSPLRLPLRERASEFLHFLGNIEPPIFLLCIVAIVAVVAAGLMGMLLARVGGGGVQLHVRTYRVRHT